MIIKFTGHMEKNQISFLDVSLTGMGDEVYRKPLSGNSLLQAQSANPKCTIKSIPVGQFVRLRRICSDQLQFEQESLGLYSCFLNHGYPKWVLDRAFNIAKGKNRADLLNKKRLEQCKNTRKLTFSSSYSLQFEQIGCIIDRYLPLLFQDPICYNILKDRIVWKQPGRVPKSRDQGFGSI